MSRKEIEQGDIFAKLVPHDKRYAVSKCGRVFSRALGNWRELKPTSSGGRRRGGEYSYVTIGAKRTGVHQLVMLVFKGAPKPGQEVRHRDGNPKNNTLKNLTYGTRAQNMADAVRHGTTPKGTKNPQAILRPKDVLRIRALRASGETCISVGRRFGVSLEIVSQIARRTRWGWLE